MNHRLRLFFFVTLACTATLTGTGCGGDDGSAGGTTTPARVVDVTMRDNVFDPAALSVAEGETVEFRFTNDGRVVHDAFVGDSKAQAEHETEMIDEGGHHHDGDAAVTVQPGETATLHHTFVHAGTVEVGCHQPGHFAAGMIMTITVA